MYARFVDSFPQNKEFRDTGYYYYDCGRKKSFYRLGVDSKVFNELLEEESKGNLVIKRAIFKTKNHQKKTLLHCVPSIYGVAPDDFFHYILPSDWEAFRKLTVNKADCLAPSTAESLRKPWITHINEQSAAFYGILLAPYTEASKDLFYLLIAQDDVLARTPLHEAIAEMRYFSAFQPLLTRIAQSGSGAFTAEQKEKIALLPNKKGQTLFHDLVYRFNLAAVREIVSAFNTEIFKKSLQKPNKIKETPLHLLCLSNTDRLNKTKFIREILASSSEKKIETRETTTVLVESKEQLHVILHDASLRTMFQQRLEDKANPLHLACQIPAADAKEDADLMMEMKAILGDVFTQKIKEQDAKGNTPLDYAFRQSPRSNVPLIRAILINLISSEADSLLPLVISCQYKTENTSQDAKFFNALANNFAEIYPVKVMMTDPSGNTPLHWAIISPANTELVEEIFSRLSLQQQKDLALVKNNKGQTALELACQNGDLRMLNLIIRALGPGTFFEFRKRIPLAKLVEKNHRLSLSEFERVVGENNSLFDLIDYHISGKSNYGFTKNKNRNDVNIMQRRIDTRDRLEAFSQGKQQPEPKERFRAKSEFAGAHTPSQKYFELSEQVFTVNQNDEKFSQQEYKECKEFFSEKLSTHPTKLHLLGLKSEEAELVDALFGRKSDEFLSPSEAKEISYDAPVVIVPPVPLPIAYVLPKSASTFRAERTAPISIAPKKTECKEMAASSEGVLRESSALVTEKVFPALEGILYSHDAEPGLNRHSLFASATHSSDPLSGVPICAPGIINWDGTRPTPVVESKEVAVDQNTSLVAHPHTSFWMTPAAPVLIPTPSAPTEEEPEVEAYRSPAPRAKKKVAQPVLA